MTNMTYILLLAQHRSARVVLCILLAVTVYQVLARHRSATTLPALCSAALCSAAIAVQHGGIKHSCVHGGRGGRALQGALASGGLTTKIFLYNKLPT
jgi:hypothetical protein